MMSSLLDLDCNKEKIRQFITDAHMQPVTMSGMVKDLQKIKNVIKEVYDRAAYMTYDIGYHGWSGDAAENMCEIEDAITKRMMEIYALCLIGLGEIPG